MTSESPLQVLHSAPETEVCILRLYVADAAPKSLTALANLKRLCEERLDSRYAIEVIDLIEQPQLAAADEILAVPTLVRPLPEPARKVIGDLSDQERVIVALRLLTKDQ